PRCAVLATSPTWHRTCREETYTDTRGPPLLAADMRGVEFSTASVPNGHDRCLAPDVERRHDLDTNTTSQAGRFSPESRLSGGDLRDAVVPQRAHAFRDGGALELLAARLRRGEALELLAHLEQLVDADPAAIPGLVAPRAAALAVEDHAVRGRRDVRRHARPQ